MEMHTDTEHLYRGARANVLLHERHMRRFLAAWRLAREEGVDLPPTDDPDYATLDALLRHVLECARTYMVWMCEQLELPDPGIRPVPDLAAIEPEAEGYLEHLLGRWRTPLREVPEERFYEIFLFSSSKVPYCVDVMLEHAVMHPIRHVFQLEELMA
jgi:hypothetical protein